MSDDESSGSEVEEVKPKQQSKAKSKPSSMPKTDGLDEASVELLELNRKDRDKMEEEIQELRARAEKRKKQRDIEEKRQAAERVAEEERRKTVEEEKKKKREEDELRTISERAKKQAEFEKMRNFSGPNFVIKKKDQPDSKEAVKDKKSKEQLETEKKAILSQRVQSLEIAGFDSSKLKEKAKDLLKVIYKLEGEKYDLEKRFKTQQVDMMELAEKARQANKVGKGGLKRVQPSEEGDIIQTRFAGTPAKIEMYSKYERQTDKREYSEKKERFSGPQFISPADRIKPTKSIKWDDDRIPLYCGESPHDEQQQQLAE